MRHSYWRNVQILTDRFMLRPITEGDVTANYLGWFNNASLPFISMHPKSLKELHQYVISKIYRKDTLFLGIFTREGNTHIGNLKFEPIDFDKSEAVLGILIGEPEWRGHAVGPEIILSAAAWLRLKVGIKRLSLGVHVANHRAYRAYQKIGFRFGFTDLIPDQAEILHLTLNIDAVAEKP